MHDDGGVREYENSEGKENGDDVPIPKIPNSFVDFVMEEFRRFQEIGRKPRAVGLVNHLVFEEHCPLAEKREEEDR